MSAAALDESSPNLASVVSSDATSVIEMEQARAEHYRVQMYKMVVPAFLLLSLFAVLANSLVILALRSSRVRNATVTLLLSLTFSDIWTSTVMALSLLLNSYLPVIYHTRPRPCLSLSLEMLRTGGLLTGALHLLLIALHHCVGIIRPHANKVHLRQIAFALCVLAWTVPTAVLWLLALLRPGQGFWNCERVDFYHEKGFRWAISVLLLAMFLVISVCYIRLISILHVQSGKLPSPTGVLPSERKRRRERRTLWTTLLICTSFLLGWAPASIMFALTCADCRVLSGYRLLFALSCIQLTFLLAKSLLNPLIYSCRIPEVKQQLRGVLRCTHMLRNGSDEIVLNRAGGICIGQSKRKLQNKRSQLFVSSQSSSGGGGGGREYSILGGGATGTGGSKKAKKQEQKQRKMNNSDKVDRHCAAILQRLIAPITGNNNNNAAAGGG